MSSSGVIPHEEVLSHIYNFLDEFGYTDSLLALQSESGVPHNTIRVVQPGEQPQQLLLQHQGNATTRGLPPPSPEALEQAVLNGNWSEVLHVYVDRLLLPEEIRFSLYEAIFEEFLLLHGLQPAARALLGNAPALVKMKHAAPARHVRLEQMLSAFDPAQWEEKQKRMGTTMTLDMQKKRATILKQLQMAITFTSTAPSGSLAAALFLAATTQQQAHKEGSETPLRKRPRGADTTPILQSMRSWSNTFIEYPVTAPRQVTSRVDYAAEKAVSCCLPLPEPVGDQPAAVVVVGGADGAVSFMNPDDGTLVGKGASHTDGVLSLACDVAASSPTYEAPAATKVWIGVGYRDGWVKLYNANTHQLVRRFQQVHGMGVTSLVFAGERMEQLAGHSSLVVTGSYDTKIHVLSIVSASVLCTVSDGHYGAFVNALCGVSWGMPAGSEIAPPHRRHAVMSAGNDGTLAFWTVHDEKGTASRVGKNKSIRSLYKACKDAVPTSLSPLTSSSEDSAAGTTAEVVVCTRSTSALIVSLAWSSQSEHLSDPIQSTTLCVIEASKIFRHVSPHVSQTPTSPVPMLTVYGCDEDGTVLLYNIAMDWRDEEKWRSFGGAVKVTHPTDQSPSVVADVGKAVNDLKVYGVWRPSKPPMMVACAPSLPTLYLME